MPGRRTFSSWLQRRRRSTRVITSTTGAPFLPRFAAMSEEEFLAFAESKPLRKEFILSMGRKGFPQKEIDAAIQRLRRTYERMDSEIEKSRGPWLLGEELSLADIALMPAIVRMAVDPQVL